MKKVEDIGLKNEDVTPEPEAPVVMSCDLLNTLIEDDVNDILTQLSKLYEKVISIEISEYKWEVGSDFDITPAGRGLESIIQLTAKIKDKTDGKPIVKCDTRKYRETCVYKIRKALGYTYP